MDKKEFVSTVRRKAPAGIPRRVVDLAADVFFDFRQEKNSVGYWDVSDAIVLAGRVNEATKSTASAPGLLLVPTASDLLASERICANLEPEVIALRRKLFGSGARPFSEPEEAKKWIEKRAPTRLPKRSRRTVAPILAQLEKLRRSTGVNFVPDDQSLHYPDATSKGWVRVTNTQFGSGLYALAKGVQRIASRANVPPVAVTSWVLGGARPVIPRVSVTEHSGMRQWVTLEINASDLTWRELRQLYGAIRALPSLSRQKINPLHYRIFQMVRQRGGVPRRGRVAFWRRIHQDLIAEGRWKKVPGTWNAIKKAYVSVSGQLSAR